MERGGYDGSLRTVSLADLRPGASVLVDHDGSWWSGRVTKVRKGAVRVEYNVMGSVVPKDFKGHEVALRLDPAAHAAPEVGARVLAAEHFDVHARAGADERITGMLGWGRGEVVAVEDGRFVVKFAGEEGERARLSDPLPLAAIACFVESAPVAEAGLERVRGTIRHASCDGPVLVAAAVTQDDVPVEPRRTFHVPFMLELADGARVRVELAGWPHVTPTTRVRDTWDDLRSHALAAPFNDFSPGPHEKFELSGEVVAVGDEVEVVGIRGGDVLRPRLIAGGRGAVGEAAAFLARHAPAEERRARPPWGHLVPLALAVVAALVWLLGGPEAAAAGRVTMCLLLACAAYHHRSVRPLTRFRRRLPAKQAPFAVSGEPERGPTTGLLPVYFVLGLLAVPVVSLLVVLGREADMTWLGGAVAAAWSLALVLVLVVREGPQARVLRIFARAGQHREPGAWGVSCGTYAAGETFARTINIHHWSTSRTVTETVQLAGGGTTQVQRQVSDHHSVAGRVESLPDAIMVTTASGTLAVRGCRQAVWGTATPRHEDVAKPEGTLRDRIVEQIAPGDAIAVYGRFKADPQPRIEHTGAGSLMIFGAPAGTDAHAVARARLRGHVGSLVLIAAAALPAIAALLAR